MLLWATRVALLGAAASAVPLARRRADHWPVALFLAWLVLGETIRSVLIQRFYLARSLEAPPHVGAARIAFHVHQATELAWSAGLAAMAVLVFSRRRWPLALIALVWASTVAYLVTGYPAVRGDELR